MPVSFGTKAETLARLSKRLKTAVVLPLFVVTRRQWASGRKTQLARLSRHPWARDRLIVRSSALSEDRAGKSQAGKFLSVAGVLAESGLDKAVDRVFASYRSRNAKDQVLIQPEVIRPRHAGVAFTRDPASGAPYYVINYDSSGDPTAVTGGLAQNLSTFVMFRGAPRKPSGWLGALCRLMTELETLLTSDALDIEFAVDRSNRLILLQVRPLPPLPPASLSPDQHAQVLDEIGARVKRGNDPYPNVVGERTVFGVMPDWNPAEMIGTRPRPLTVSLYKDLITDSIWAYQRNNYGYRNLRSSPLLVSFHGLPYIDVRVSFGSFVPAGLPEPLAGRLVDYYVERLRQIPALHDKVEFEIVHSCFVPDLERRLMPLRDHGFTGSDLAHLSAALKHVTRNIIHEKRGLWRTDRAKIDILSVRQSQMPQRRLDLVEQIYWLIEDCKRYGTLPFAGLARAAFIAVQFLRSLRDLGVFPEDEHTAFMSSLDTVTARMHRDLSTLGRGAFLREYGHLRPGAYDILSPRYDEKPERYFDFRAAKAEAAAPTFALSKRTQVAIDRLLEQHDLGMTATELFGFFAAAIQGREYGKFVFTRSVSDALSSLKALGRQHGFTPDDMSFAEIGAIQRLYASSLNPRDVLGRAIETGRAEFARTLQINLPPVIRDAGEVYAFHMPPNEPNYITQLAAEGPARESSVAATQLANAIVLIPAADPGFDWIFARGIAGFVTAYGGANSHMAIRASELRLPAVIGVGEGTYAACVAARRLRIDCANRRIEILS